MTDLCIATGSLTQQALAGKVAIVTGAGGGIGLEAARALIWLGARVVIAEISRTAGQAAAQQLNGEVAAPGPDGVPVALFVRTDVGDERGVRRMVRKAEATFGPVDIVINNATVAPLGAVAELPVAAWDASYRVNLRGPALLARAVLPGMIARGYGVFVCVSSVGQGYMAPYEAVKAAQVHLGATLDAELEGSGVRAFTIGPGFVPTQTALSAIPRLAALMGKPTAELQAIVAGHAISVEAAGAGFAAAVAMADRYHGQEISSVQALIDAGIEVPDSDAASPAQAARTLSDAELERARLLVRRVHATLAEQVAGWQERNVFERQWMVRTFRSDAQLAAEVWLARLAELESLAGADDGAGLLSTSAPFAALKAHYEHLYSLAQGYVKDPLERDKQLAVVQGWIDDVTALIALLGR